MNAAEPGSTGECFVNQDILSATFARIKPHALVSALAAASLLTLTLSAQAQSDSSLLAVGSAPARSTPKASTAGTAAKTPSAKAATTSASKPAASNSAASKPAANKSAASRSTAAGKPATASRSQANRNNAKKPATTQRASAPRPVGPAALTGLWQESACAPLASARVTEPLYVKRQYQFDDRKKDWQLDATVFADGHCTAASQMLSFRGEGSYSLKGATRSGTNDWNADLRIDGWQVTPTNREGVMALLNARCGRGEFATGKAIDLSRTGCAPLGIESIAQRPSERERIRIADGKVLVGAHSLSPAARAERPAQMSRVGLPQAAN